MKLFIALIILVVLIIAIIQSLREKKRCPRCSVGRLKFADMWMNSNSWSYYECDNCKAKLKVFLDGKVEDCDIEEWSQWT